MNWYIGQKIVCIDSVNARTRHGKESGLKKGKTYTITGIRKLCCSVYISVGIVCDYDTLSCAKCKIKHIPTNEWEFSERRFAPIEEIPESHEEAIKELLKETICQTL